ncbi:DNA polymerase III subunit gamma/tau [Pyxidicoccus trucidator]|uniref:DNA polymerase III subunit gamma/tau n=1 Tax=Pyxidicoccus trucidator TaxID=2709662 RepID=UPI0019670E2B|nr:DNA polymerase III subunit gamma/tau [Pyxidicoccus trucidator]
MAEAQRFAEPMRSGTAIPVMPPMAPTGPIMDDLPPSAARPLSFLRNGGGAGATAMAAASPSAVPAYAAEDLVPSGPLMDGLPPSAARPLSFLRKGGAAQPAAPAVPPQAPAGATPLSRTTEPAPTVRVTNVRKPEPSGPSEPSDYGEDDDSRYYPEEASPEGCASGECIPDAAESALDSVAATPVADTATVHAPAIFEPALGSVATASAALASAPASLPSESGPITAAPASLGSTPGSLAATPAALASAPVAGAAHAPTSGNGLPTAARAPASAPPAGAPRAFAPAPPAAPVTRAPVAPSAPDLEPEPEPEPAAAPAPVARSRDNPNLPLIDRWRAAVETLKGTSLRHGTALANGRLMSMKAGEIILGYLPTAGLHRMTVSAAAGKAVIDKALAEHFGRPVKLSFQDITADDTRATLSIAEQDAQSRSNHEKSTEGKVRGHPAVRAVLKFLGGEIEHIQVYEPERPSAVPTADTPDDSA